MLGPDSKPRSWGSRVLVLCDVLGSESRSSPCIICSGTVGVSLPGWCTEPLGTEDLRASSVSATSVGAAVVFHQRGVEGGPAGRESLRCLCSALSYEQQACRLQQARLPTGGKPNTLCQGHSEINVPGLAVSTGPLSVCLSLCSFHGCLFCFMAAHVLFYRLW